MLMPTACGMSYSWLDKVAVRAMSNAVAIAMANFANGSNAGEVGSYWGHSVGADPFGEFVQVAPGNAGGPGLDGGEGVFIAEFDIGELRAYRKTQRARRLLSPPLAPELCRIPLSQPYHQSQCDSHRMWP